MRTRIFPLLLGLTLALPALADDRCKVIVHPSNHLSAIERERLSRLFLKKETRWDTGELVLPVDQIDGPTREAFTRQLLGRTPNGVKSYWEQLIYSGRDIPPPQKQTDAEVVEFVKSRPGAIGYVSASAPTDGVKVIEVGGAKP